MRFQILLPAIIGVATAADCSKGRQDCDAMVQMFEHEYWNGKFMYWGHQDSILDSWRAPCLNHNEPWGISSIKMMRHDSGKDWGCRLYEEHDCRGASAFQYESNWGFLAADLEDFNDRTKSYKCYFKEITI
ncbi:hypothetical protein P280DRAFT_484524 [Massarina eburnea CBS 473.64]|uniref:Avirulence Effector AvrLm4-7 domain-containing protein n=1 Tax=Massarina eburnea CBS 473.64 TaxID=1395130 RepID=A0A6A6RJX6_9PLEO|nr:hypothetical protein P280DRAFT_484524 [Massarina eburnea CBS 473.64]